MSESQNQKILRLLRESLKTKWYAQSPIDIYENCPFCTESVARCASARIEHRYIDECEECLCPKTICADHADQGFIMFIKEQYATEMFIKEQYATEMDIKICNIDPDLLRRMRQRFQRQIRKYEAKVRGEEI